jgi:hypothetical protein
MHTPTANDNHASSTQQSPSKFTASDGHRNSADLPLLL